MNFIGNNDVWALGLMSGTSADGIDAALLQTDGLCIKEFGPTQFKPYETDLRKRILSAYGKKPTEATEGLAHLITQQHAEIVVSLLSKTNIRPDVIGFHGQTVFHRPPTPEVKGETYQIGNGDLLASLTGITVVEQFRLNDIAHGGQGAPLVPLFHQALTHDLPKPIAVLNIGGVANITWIGEKEDELLAFDTGPGNALIDDWVYKNTGMSCDEGGRFAACGRIHDAYIQKWLQKDYFRKQPPKSLDRQAFHDCLKDVTTLPFEDGVATLTAFTAAAVLHGVSFFPENPKMYIVTGGGSHNETLLNMLSQYIEISVNRSSQYNWNNDALEAQAFAFLAVRSLKGLPLSIPNTTGVPYPLTGGKHCFIR
jgi:anhydro-N-acetylmuramic acid kinase